MDLTMDELMSEKDHGGSKLGNSTLSEHETSDKLVDESGILENLALEDNTNVPGSTKSTKKEIFSSADRIELLEDYSEYGMEELISILERVIQEHDPGEIKPTVDNIKLNYYKKQKQRVDETRKRFVAEGGEIHDFKHDPFPEEAILKELLQTYKDKRSLYLGNVEKIKQENLIKKNEVLEGIKSLIDGTESFNKTFQEFKDFQRKWHEIGIVPQDEVKNLWESYHHHVEKFYDFVKINKELRDLDLRKNLEAKIHLCEKAEGLLLESSIRTAFDKLQKLHGLWREIGPVAEDKKDEIWERFKEVSSIIKKHLQEYYESQKEEQNRNLDTKTLLCEKAEEIAAGIYMTHQDWVKQTEEIINLQNVWKSIGFAPKKQNNAIYERFKTSTDNFFEKKREFYQQTKDVQTNNYEIKLDLCVQAEALQESTDWKNTTEEFIKLQKAWKKTGHVPRKKSDFIWNRFRVACDLFFERKTNYFASLDSLLDDNLAKKEELIKKVKELTLTGDNEKDLEVLKQIQKEWTETGSVPMKMKNELQNRFRDAINDSFDNLQIDDYKKNILKYKSKLEGFALQTNTREVIETEREMLVQKLSKLESEIQLWENNIGFFSTSSKAEGLIRDVMNKIERGKESVKLVKAKLDMLNKHSKL